MRHGLIAAGCGASALAFVLLSRWLRLQRRLYMLEAEATRLATDLSKARALRQSERAGRTAAEHRLRQNQQSPPPAESSAPTAALVSAYHLRYVPIGRIASCFVERRGTPRQGLLVPAARARLRLDPTVIQPAAALEGLDGFSHVWLLYDFHENTNSAKGGHQVRAKVHPPGLGGERIGLFATRTPHRPNPIGLSAARLLAVEGDSLLLGGADIVDGTPILDVKPYLRHDVHVDIAAPSWCENRGARLPVPPCSVRSSGASRPTLMP